MKKNRRLRPIRMRDVVGGQQYLVVFVDLRDGSLELDHYTLCGQPFKRDGDWFYRTAKKLPGIDPFIDLRFPIVSASMIGLVDNPELFTPDRTFRYTVENYQKLKDIVERQAGDEYFDLLDLSDEEILRLIEEVDFVHLTMAAGRCSSWFDKEVKRLPPISIH